MTSHIGATFSTHNIWIISKLLGDCMRIQGFQGSGIQVTGKASAYFAACCWVSERNQKAWPPCRENSMSAQADCIEI